MRILILSLTLLLFASTTAIAVHSPVTTGDIDVVIDDNRGDHSSIFKKASVWVKNTFTKVTDFIKKHTSEEDKDMLLLILTILVPPLAMYIYEGETWTNRCTVNLILTILCLIPGIIHAAVIIYGKK